MNAATRRPRKRPDPILAALNRLITETDRTIAAAARARRARLKLAKLLRENAMPEVPAHA